MATRRKAKGKAPAADAPRLLRINVEAGDLKGAAVVRPRGERWFYADDPWGNPLCFVEEGTVYPG